MADKEPDANDKGESHEKGEHKIGDVKKGALHEMLGFKPNEHIPRSLLEKIMHTKVGGTVHCNGEDRTVTKLMHERANFALNAASWGLKDHHRG